MFVAFFMGRMVEAGNYWATLLALIIVLIFCLLIAMFAPEVPQKKAPLKLNWRPFLRLVGMTITFTTIILASGAAVKQVMQWSIRLPSDCIHVGDRRGWSDSDVYSHRIGGMDKCSHQYW